MTITTTTEFSPKIHEMLKAIPWGEMRIENNGLIRHPEKYCPLAVWTGSNYLYDTIAAQRGMSHADIRLVMRAADCRDGGGEDSGAKLRKAMRDRISKARRRG